MQMNLRTWPREFRSSILYHRDNWSMRQIYLPHNPCFRPREPCSPSRRTTDRDQRQFCLHQERCNRNLPHPASPCARTAPPTRAWQTGNESERESVETFHENDQMVFPRRHLPPTIRKNRPEFEDIENAGDAVRLMSKLLALVCQWRISGKMASRVGANIGKPSRRDAIEGSRGRDISPRPEGEIRRLKCDSGAHRLGLRYRCTYA